MPRIRLSALVQTRSSPALITDSPSGHSYSLLNLHPPVDQLLQAIVFSWATRETSRSAHSLEILNFTQQLFFSLKIRVTHYLLYIQAIQRSLLAGVKTITGPG